MPMFLLDCQEKSPEGRREDLERSDTPIRQQHAQDTRRRREHHAFGEQLTENASCSGAECCDLTVWLSDAALDA